MSNLFGGGGPKSKQPTAALGLDLQTAEYGKVLQVAFGRNKWAGTVIWYGQFKSIKHTEKPQGGKGGGSSQKSVSYTYTSSYMVAMCEGVATPIKVYDGASEQSLATAGGIAFTGALGQAAWNNLSGNEILGYSGTSVIAFKDKKLGDQPSLPQLSFEMAGRNQLNPAGGVYDADPADIATAICTDPGIGVGFTALGSLTQWSNYCRAAGLLFSPVYDTQQPALQVLSELLKYSNSEGWFSEGVLKVKPRGDRTLTGNGVTFTPDLTPVANLGPNDLITNGANPPVQIRRKSPADAMNVVRIEHRERGQKYRTIPATATIDEDMVNTGVRAETSETVDMITNGKVGQLVADNMVQRDFYVRNEYEFKLSWRYCYLEPMDIVTLTDVTTGLNLTPVRIRAISEDADGLLKIDAEEMPEGIGHAAFLDPQAASGLGVNPDANPGPVRAPYIFRAPNALVSVGQPEVWIAVAGDDPLWAGCEVHLSRDGVSYTYHSTFARESTYGVTTTALGVTADPYTAGSVNVVLNGGETLLGCTATECDEFVTMSMLDDELIAYQTATLAAGPSYNLGTRIRRGGYGTAIAAHAAGAKFVRLDEDILRIPIDPSQVGTTLYVKFVSLNVFGRGGRTLADETAYSYVVGTRSDFPDVPATPSAFTVTPVSDGVNLKWQHVSPAAVGSTTIEFAPSSGGPFTVLSEAGATQTSFHHAFPTGATYFYRLRSRGHQVSGGWSAYTSVLSATGRVIGGRGINLLPDAYSTLESATLPAINSAGLTISRSTGANGFKVAAGYYIVRSGGGSEGYLYFGNATNIPRTPGVRYILSFFYRTGSAALAKTHEAYFYDGVSTHVAGTWTCVADNQWRRAAVLIDCSTLTGDRMMARVDIDTATLGADILIDGVMVEESTGVVAEPSAYSRGQTASLALSALIQALDARAVADGQVDIYRQSAPPSIGGAGAKLGDYWQDSDDGKWYYCNGGSWVESTDSRLPQAIIDASNAQSSANTAQTTANARIRLFVQEAQPSGGTYIVGDMWYQSSTTLTRYYNGTGWSLQADRTTAVADLMVANGDFEAQSYSWSFENNWYVETSANAALIGTGLVHFANASIPASRASNGVRFKVTPGARIRVQAYIRNLGSAANGTASANVVWADQNANYLGEDGPSYANGSAVAGAPQWRRCVKTVTAPANAVYAYVSALVTGHTTGYWCFDNFRASYSVDSLDEVPDGSQYNRIVSTAVQGGVPTGTSNYGTNLVPNPGFELNKMGKPVNTFVTSGDVIDGWKVLSSTIGYPMVESGIGAVARSGSNKVTLLASSNVSLPPGTSGDCSIVSNDKIPVNPGERYVVQSFFGVYSDAALPAGMTWRVAFAMVFYNAAGAYIGEIANNLNNGGSAPGFGSVPLTTQGVAPAGAAYAQFWLLLRLANPTGGALVTPPSGTVCLPYFDDLFAAKISNLDNDVDHGTVYGKPANTDLFDDAGSGGIRRIGLNVKGSRKILGGARNSRASIVYGAASVRTATALTANSSGQVTVNAHNVEISGETVTYNAVTNAVTGLTQGVTYVIFTLDPFLDGGTRTYYAQTSVLNAQQAGEGAVFIGNVTIPTSGTGTGGGPGVGNPGDWCVDWDTVLPDGRLVRDLRLGDLVRCIDVRTGEVGDYPLLGMGFGEEDCYRLVTAELHSIVQSRSTPMDLPDGSVVTTEGMAGRAVYVLADGEPRLSVVADLQFIGPRRVLKPDLGNRMFFAGEAAHATIATHNAQYKP